MADYDFFVIGGGSGGVRAARIAGGHGAKVAVAEERYLGGTCVNVGCVPKKLLVYASHFGEDFEDAAGFGWTVGERRFDWARLIANKNSEIERLNTVYARMLEASGVDVFDGHADLVDAHTVAVGEQTFSADTILVAVGGWPAKPDVPGAEYAITSNEAFFLDGLPERVVVVGGGYIAVEFAGIFHGLGARVTQLYRGPLFLRGFDQDVRATLAEEMAKKGIELCFNANIAGIEQADGALRATLEDGATIDADCIMYATGRAPLTANIGLENAGVALNAKGAIVVDAYSKTSVDNIYAVGDVVDPMRAELVAGARDPDNGHLVDSLSEAAALFDSFFFRPPQSRQDGELSSSAPVNENTTIGVIATNLALSKSEATNLARMAQTGVSRTTRPAHTLYDGDCLFSLATGALNASVELSLLGAVAADVVAAAVLDGVRNADPAHGLPAASELTPRPLSQQSWFAFPT